MPDDRRKKRTKRELRKAGLRVVRCRLVIEDKDPTGDAKPRK